MKSPARICAAVLALAAFSATAAAPWNLDALMQTLAAAAGGRVAFVERKHITLLDAPLVSRGEMRFTPPARLERLTREPAAESMVLDGDHLQIRRDGRALDLQLRNHPEAAAFIDSIRGTLAGDRDALERNFALSLAGDRQDWRLDLLPRDAKLAELVLRIHITGSDGRISLIEILQADGDRSELRLTPIDDSE
ncbi:MAG: outer membrane lipoprotein carrier protein LolA [Zoogloeaceae bacterium]|nr:outer membrane lipoprotein carrier protein LolA [Rhodocyclaceae bacterium]MCP5237073.1 outer membrane lipoprotein carrier protein LolA [Zoogloeaceae bacterium]